MKWICKKVQVVRSSGSEDHDGWRNCLLWWRTSHVTWGSWQKRSTEPVAGSTGIVFSFYHLPPNYVCEGGGSTGIVFSFYHLPPNYVCWLPSASEPRLPKSHDFYNLLSPRGRWTAKQEWKVLRTTLHPIGYLLLGRSDGPKPRHSKSWNFPTSSLRRWTSGWGL
jgi:hypothetical protein